MKSDKVMNNCVGSVLKMNSIEMLVDDVEEYVEEQLHK